MPSLPIPLVSSLVLGWLLLRLRFVDRRYGPLALLLALCAVQGVIISMAQHYHVPGMRLVQPLTATLIPPMGWVAFRITAVRGFERADLVHLLGPACAVLCILTMPALLDILIPALFCGYGAAILWHNRQGGDALPRMRLASGETPAYLWRIVGAALVGSAFSDVLIVAAQIGGVGYLTPWIVSVYSGVMLLIIGVVCFSDDLAQTEADDAAPESPAPHAVSDQDSDIFARIETLMAEREPYLDPDLTLARLARKLGVPAKQLSAAINRVTGENVSRYINAARIRAAQDALSKGDSVTNAMLSSGFNTKSNFNREFTRVTGTTPTHWAEAHGR